MSSMSSRDYYDVLGVARDATQDEIKSAYRRCARACHPDMARRGDQSFIELQTAYDVLSDVEERRAYDRRSRLEATHAPGVSGVRQAEPYRSARTPAEPISPVESFFDERGHRPHRRAEPPWQTPAPDAFTSVFDRLMDALWGDTLRDRAPFRRFRRDDFWPW